MTFIKQFSDSAKNSLRSIHTLELWNYTAILSATHLGLRQFMSHAHTLFFHLQVPAGAGFPRDEDWTRAYN